jgi:hypothetical protein
MTKKYLYSFLLFIVIGFAYAQNNPAQQQPNEAKYSSQSIDGLSIYPNPAMINEKIYIESTKNDAKYVELYNVVGKKIFSTTINSKELLLPNSVNAGIYIIKIKEGTASSTRKIVIK